MRSFLIIGWSSLLTLLASLWAGTHEHTRLIMGVCIGGILLILSCGGLDQKEKMPTRILGVICITMLAVVAAWADMH